MKKDAITAAAGKTPSVVLAAFAPATEFELTLDGWILLEAMHNRYAVGGVIRMRDSLELLLVMTDTDAVRAAHRKGQEALENLVYAAAKKRNPAEFIALRPKLEEAMQAALAPVYTDGEDKKKPSQESDGG